MNKVISIDLSPILLDKDGVMVKAKSPKTIINEEGIEIETLEDKIVTLGVMLSKAMIRNDGTHDEIDVIKRYDLHKRIYNKEIVDISEEEEVYLRKMVCDSFEVFFAGQILEILDNQKKNVK